MCCCAPCPSTLFSLVQAAVPPQPGEEGIKLKAVIGYNGNGRGNMVWSPDQGSYDAMKVEINKLSEPKHNRVKYHGIKDKLVPSLQLKYTLKQQHYSHNCIPEGGCLVIITGDWSDSGIDVSCRFICVLVWQCGGGGAPSHRMSETLTGPQRGDLLSYSHT